MLQRYRKVYLKARISSQGKKVVKIEQLKKKIFRYSYFDKKLFSHETDSLEYLINDLQTLFKKNPLIIQRAINLIKVRDKISDLRATVQRNGKGELEIVSIAFRLSDKYSPITSTRAKSTVYSFNDFMKEYNYLIKKNKDTFKKEIEHFLKRLYTAIEQEYGFFGEIGIDFGVDRKGKLWFIEPNAKPAKDTLHLSQDKETIRKAFLLPLEYAKYITGFNQK
ncbi:hypothetical protein BHF71_02970 [Vulcanibacillus modesticaldus]|uniref:ATP-grasp domain-containing protein n=2 Tax=Vulcanibacillus modesticaldus TaxID=337097 RepID=A0A1D2YT78_9BACI|nr:hypothetical protein BHF71_02970 [Vulcanibacillus modesticaldus]